MATQVKIAAKENSVTGGVGASTGVAVKPGNMIVITANPLDKWTAGPGDRTSGVNGLGNPLGGNFGLFTKGDFRFLYGSLVGSLDKGRTFFPVGSYLAMTVLTPGELTLHYWDENNGDNSGSVLATVQVLEGPQNA